MKKTLPTLLLGCLFLGVHFPLAGQSGGSREKIDEQVIELEPFVVYEGLIDVIDGFTGESYHDSNAVVDGFQETFNQILLGYHRKLLHDEYNHMMKRMEEGKQFSTDLDSLANSFGIRGKTFNERSFLRIERAIFTRLMEDPFFKIEALVVWDLDRLKRNQPRKPRSRYSKNIRFNEESGEWERRVMTEWKANFRVYRNNGDSEYFEILKEQGLNLDTNEGFHFINRGLTGHVTPEAFNDVKLTYPIFVNSKESVDLQIERLQQTYLHNLIHIYDPFSWAWRRNMRFRGGFQRELIRNVKSTQFKITDRDWFDEVLSFFLNDVVTIKFQGVDEIYDLAMLQKVPVNLNILGQDLDLLNWEDGENRSVPYDPDTQRRAGINFNNPKTARFIVLDAYRRYHDVFTSALRDKLANLDKKTSGKDLIKEVIEEVSGIPADVYIKKATDVQIAELKKHKYAL